MIRNRGVFDVKGWVPEDIVDHDGALDAVSAPVDSVVQYAEGRQTHTFGPSGAGKTCLGRYVLNQLAAEAPHINRQYINCWNHQVPLVLVTISSLHPDLRH
jgi:Cdc6-like AAA superfamily ATPase